MNTMNNKASIELQLPEHDLTTFSMFELNQAAAQSWAQNLSVTSTKQAALQLKIAIEQLNRVKMAAGTRFSIMEALRPSVKIELASLAKHYLDQALTLADEPQKMAGIASSLCGLCVSAYSLVAINTLQQRQTPVHSKAARLVCTAIQRALSFAGSKILQTYQLYRPIEPKSWLELHQLYALGERQGLATLVVEDEQSAQTTSIAQSFLQSALLSCCKPNQLQQKDLAVIYRGLEEWSERVKIVGTDAFGLFQLDLESDRPPIYSAMSEGSQSDNSRLLDTSGLIEHLQQLKVQDRAAGRQGIKFDRDTTLPSNLLEHLVNALGVMSKRNFARKKDTGTLDISLGLSNAHYYLADNQDFEQVIHGAKTVTDQRQAIRFLTKSKHHDMWEEANLHESSHANPVAAGIHMDTVTHASLKHKDKAGKPGPRFPRYESKYINSSPSGYCLSWSDDLPQDIKSGEIICVREQSNQDWIIAVTRWVSALGDDRTLVGIELLSPSAVPYGAKVLHTETRQAEVLSKVLLLPEIKLIGQASTLITPRTGFKEKQKVQLVKASEKFSVQLTRQVAATPGYAQFEFKYIKLLGDIIAENKSGTIQPTYDSMWKNL
jgi:hypothetical protein